ncbi:hypothetical protein KBB68_01255 [Candidatus Babeliales bacterium]|nr:hypothetical protein [Candidatus Babeliales bacterium]
MKKTFMSVILGFSFFVHGENKLSFADCVEQTFGTKYGNRVHWATLRLKTLSNGEIVTNNNPEQNKLTVGGKIAKALQENKQYLKCLKLTTAIFMQKNADESIFLY